LLVSFLFFSGMIEEDERGDMMSAHAHLGGGRSAACAQLPNLLVCGTPGTGKSTLCSAVAERCGLRHIVLGDVARARGLHAGPCADAAWEGALALDGDAEDALLDALEPEMAAGGVVLEHHTVDFFPERWFGRVLVLRCETDVLFDRLTARGYGARKVEENVCAEIMCVVAEEARDSYAAAVVRELPANSLDDLDAAVASVEAWLEDVRAAAAAEPPQPQPQPVAAS
jgi:adenylate kinase